MEESIKQAIQLLSVRQNERLRERYVQNNQLRAQDNRDRLQSFYDNSRVSPL